MTSAKRRAGEPLRARFASPINGRRAALYLRVSTGSQTTDNQRLELEAVAERCGWVIAAVYEDAGVSGAKGRNQRPQFNNLCRDAARRRFDVVMAWSVDRLGRSLQDLVAFLGDLHGSGVDLYLHQQGIDTTTPSGKVDLPWKSGEPSEKNLEIRRTSWAQPSSGRLRKNSSARRCV